MTHNLSRDIRAAFAGHETPAAIARRMGITETQVAAALRREHPKRKNWRDVAAQKTSLDTCPLRCERDRPHRIAPGLFVCAGCWELEQSE